LSIIKEGETYGEPNERMDVTLSASTRGQTVAGQVIRVPEMEFSLFGQYEADMKFAYNLKLESNASDIPTVVLSVDII
jgi:hypothetical protein